MNAPGCSHTFQLMFTPGALLNSAMEYSRAGDHASAERVCRQVIASDPSNFRAWCHVGTCCLIQNRLEDAVTAYEQAIRHQPQFPEALNNLAAALSRLGRVEEAAETFRCAVAQRPKWAEPHISLGNLFANNDRMREAADSYADAVRTEPKNAEAHSLLGSTLARIGLVDEGIAHFAEAVRLNPRYDAAHSNLLLAMNYDPKLDPSALLTEHRWFDRLHGQGLTPAAPHTNNRDPDRPLRVGYVSPDFRRHAVAGFMLPIYEAHDPKQVQVFSYAQLGTTDPTTERFRSLSSVWRVTLGKTDTQIAEQVRADQIDILVDLAGHTGGNRLGAFARRPAPIQISYLGYPNTSGVSAIQYRLTDAIADPPGEAPQHVEELVRLGGCWCCIEPPDNAPEVVPPPFLKNGYVTFGSMHKIPKLNAGVLDLWTSILSAVPNSRLLVFRNTLASIVQERLIKEFETRGIAPQRLELLQGSAKEAAHLPVYNRIDISLDSLPWSGHATTCESLWMGVPMPTLLGNRHAGRMSASILSAVGLNDWITETPEHYLRVVTALAGDPDQLSRWRTELRPMVRRSRLCDSQAFTRELESVYRDLWRRWRAGLIVPG